MILFKVQLRMSTRVKLKCTPVAYFRRMHSSLIFVGESRGKEIVKDEWAEFYDLWKYKPYVFETLVKSFA